MNTIRYIVVNGYKNADNMQIYTDKTLPCTHQETFNNLVADNMGYSYNGHSKLLRIITSNKITLSQLLAWQKIEPIELPPAAIESFGTLFSGGQINLLVRLRRGL